MESEGIDVRHLSSDIFSVLSMSIKWDNGIDAIESIVLLSLEVVLEVLQELYLFEYELESVEGGVEGK